MIYGFSNKDTQRVETHLKRLLPHLEDGRFVLAGGLAIRYHLITRGVEFPKRPFNDLDIIAQSASVVHPDAVGDFWVYHYHPGDPTHFYIVLFDPVSKTKVDIFNWSNPPVSTMNVHFSQKTLKMRSLEDQLVQTVCDMFRLFTGGITDPKQLSDAKLMLKLADLNLVDHIWRARGFDAKFDSLVKALSEIENLVLKDPGRLKKDPFKRPRPYTCPDCVSTTNFPLTPMEKIYKALGYIE